MVVGLVDIQDIKPFLTEILGEIRKITEGISNGKGLRKLQNMVQMELVSGLHALF
jgi:hypothetical protein